MIMITKKNQFSGASFDYTNDKKTCVASGEYRFENGVLSRVDMNGRLTKDKTEHTFWANVAADGKVNISGVSIEALADVSANVASAISEIKAE